jgi:hypothetical protein
MLSMGDCVGLDIGVSDGLTVRDEAQHLEGLIARLWHAVQVCQPVYTPCCRPVHISQALRAANP